MTYQLTWLPSVLKAAGLTVSTEPGWETRGHDDMGHVRGVLCHHTACGGHADMPSEHVVTEGRPDLAGPLCNLLLGREGDYKVIAAGRAWHAGAGFWHGIKNGNSEMIGIEAENAGDGKDPWPLSQMDAYVRGVAALLNHIGATASMCAGHKEYCIPTGRKIDPTFDMVQFRARVAAQMKQPVPAAPAEPERIMTMAFTPKPAPTPAPKPVAAVTVAPVAAAPAPVAATTVATDFAALLQAYDGARAGHASTLKSDQDKAVKAGMNTAPAAFTMPDFKGGFCASWTADKALLDGVKGFANWFFPGSAMVISALEAVGDQIYQSSCNLPPAK